MSTPPNLPILTENVQGDKGAVLPVPVGDVPDQALQALAQVCLAEGVLQQRLAPGGGDGATFGEGKDSPPFVGAFFTGVCLTCGLQRSAVQKPGDGGGRVGEPGHTLHLARRYSCTGCFFYPVPP